MATSANSGSKATAGLPAGSARGSMMRPGRSAVDERIDKICLLIGEEFEPYDDVYMRVLNPPMNACMPVLLTNDVVHLLASDFMPFVKEVMSQIINKALRRVSRNPRKKSMFSIIPCKGVMFTASSERQGETDYVVIELLKKCPTTKGV
jgi:hypothetical protein